MKAIIAVNKEGYIGLKGKLPWGKNSDDLKHFKKLTYGQTLLVGHNTLLELPILKDRILIMDIKGEINLDVDWCIGGKKTYEKYAPYFTELHISYIDDSTSGDTKFPDLHNLNPECDIFNYYF